MAIGFGERLAGAGQISSRFREEQMRIREARERAQQLQDAQRLRQAREAIAQGNPQFGAAGAVPFMAGVDVSGLSPVARTQPPAQGQPAPTPQQAGLVTTPQIPSAGAPDRALAAIDYADTMILPGQEAPATGGFRTRGSRKFGAPPARTRSVVEQELQQAQSRLAASRNVRGPARARILNNAQAEVERLEAELGRMPVQLGAIAPAAAPAAAAAAPTAPKQQKAQEELTQAAQTTPMGEGPSPEKLADTVAAATSGIMYGADPASFNPQAVDAAVQQSLQMRQALVNQYNALNQYGFGFRAAELIPQIQAIDLGLYKAQGEQGVYEGVSTNNWSRAVTVLSQFKGIPHQVLDRGDGRFDLYVNGEVSDTGQTASDLADYFRYQLDEGYRARKAEIAGKQFDLQNKLQEIAAEQTFTTARTLQDRILQIQGEIAKQRDKYGEVTIEPAGDGQTILIREGRNVYTLDPRGQVQKIAGVNVDLPTTTRVPGFGG